MACDFSALSNLDPQDAEQTLRLIDECTQTLSDPRLWLWALVLTVVCGAVGAMIGRRKNTVVRDAVLGAALGPIGWIISLCLPAQRPPPACPACKREVGAADAHCRHCGAALRTAKSAR
jgi:hypothetical protein